MVELPTGVVTFLFTDVEGSTRLLGEIGPERFASALAAHRGVIRAACAAHGGVEVDTQGDAFFVAFASADAAIRAATHLTAALAGGPMKVRVGIHTGRPLVSDHGYVGADVHVAARICAAGHGGQVLLSEATRALLADEPGLTDVGEHRLKDVATPVGIHQLGTASFPPLRTISNTNLPRSVSAFVGRERERRDVVALLEGGQRLVTLTGPGGSGKTRLALEAAGALVQRYRAGVFWVPLATVREPALVNETISRTLGARDDLAGHIAERELLLVLDNLEHLLDAAPALAFLLERCPNLYLLCTSRELLRLRGELEYLVPALAEPDAVALFCSRSGLVPSDVIAELCARLDNLPLGIELAAARTKALTPRDIVERLSERLDLLKGGRDAEPRQQTLRATMEWSYGLLGRDERALFRRLSVFAGGWTLAAGEEVCDANVDVLQSLVEKSLVRFTGGRYSMLETIREFARDQLSGATAVHARHSRYYLQLASSAEPHLRGRELATWLSLLDAEQGNLRAALAFLRDSGAAREMLRLAADLHRFWFYRGYLAEGRAWLEEALRLAGPETTPECAAALAAAGQLAYRHGAYDHARRVNGMALSAFRSLRDEAGVGHVLNQLADVAEAEGDLDRAERLWRWSVEVARRAGNAYGLGTAIANLGSLMLTRGDHERATPLTREALSIFEEVGNEQGAAVALENLGCAEIWAGRYAEAVPLLRESLVRFRDLQSPIYCAHSLDELAVVAALTGDALTAARLLGAVERILGETGGQLSPDTRALEQRARAAIRDRLDEPTFEAARAAGSGLTLDEVIDDALAAFA